MRCLLFCSFWGGMYFIAFGSKPTIFYLNPRDNKQYSIEETEYIASKFLKYYNFSQLYILSFYPADIFWHSNLQFSKKTLIHISLSLSFKNLIINYSDRGRNISLPPNSLFRSIIEHYGNLALSHCF